jgi:hypothetical protein
MPGLICAVGRMASCKPAPTAFAPASQTWQTLCTRKVCDLVALEVASSRCQLHSVPYCSSMSDICLQKLACSPV